MLSSNHKCVVLTLNTSSHRQTKDHNSIKVVYFPLASFPPHPHCNSVSSFLSVALCLLYLPSIYWAFEVAPTFPLSKFGWFLVIFTTQISLLCNSIHRDLFSSEEITFYPHETLNYKLIHFISHFHQQFV